MGKMGQGPTTSARQQASTEQSRELTQHQMAGLTWGHVGRQGAALTAANSCFRSAAGFILSPPTIRGMLPAQDHCKLPSQVTLICWHIFVLPGMWLALTTRTALAHFMGFGCKCAIMSGTRTWGQDTPAPFNLYPTLSVNLVSTHKSTKILFFIGQRPHRCQSLALHVANFPHFDTWHHTGFPLLIQG